MPSAHLPVNGSLAGHANVVSVRKLPSYDCLVNVTVEVAGGVDGADWLHARGRKEQLSRNQLEDADYINAASFS